MLLLGNFILKVNGIQIPILAGNMLDTICSPTRVQSELLINYNVTCFLHNFRYLYVCYVGPLIVIAVTFASKASFLTLYLVKYFIICTINIRKDTLNTLAFASILNYINRLYDIRLRMKQ